MSLTRPEAATKVGWVSDPTRSGQSPNLQRCAHHARILQPKTLTQAEARNQKGCRNWDRHQAAMTRSQPQFWSYASTCLAASPATSRA